MNLISKPLITENINSIISSYLHNWKSHYRLISSKPSESHLRTELNFLAENYKLSFIDYEGFVGLVFNTNNIAFSDIILGEFKVWVAYSFEKYLLLAGAKASKPNHPLDNSDITHPHIEANHICLGDNTEQLMSSFVCGDFDNIHHTINRLLHNYNEQSAYVRIEDWNGKKCYNCDTLIDTGAYDVGCCDIRIGCSKCTLSCKCSRKYHISCKNHCYKCKSECCKYCINGCTDCCMDYNTSPYDYSPRIIINHNTI